MRIQRQRYLLLFFIICISTHSFASYTLGNWNYTSSLNVARSVNVAVLSQSTIIYTFGGYAYTTTPYPVECATIQLDGTLSNWVIESTQMISAREDAVGFATDSYVFAIGGDNGVTYCTTAERAQINPNGSLGIWTTISILPTGITEASLVQTSTYIYIIGGYDFNTTTGSLGSSNVYQTTINPDGSLGTWTLLSSQLVTGRRSFSTVLINTTIYVAGYTKGVELATVYTDGELSTFTTISNTVAFHYDPGLFYDGEYLNVIGGYYGGDGNYRSERAQVYPDGSLGTWEPAPYLEDERDGFAYLQTSTDAYVIGGCCDTNVVEYAPILNTTDVKKRDWEIFD